MRLRFHTFSLGALLYLTACGKEDTPPTLAAPKVTYTDENGVKTNISTYRAIVANLIYVPDTIREAVIVHGLLPTGKSFEIQYFISSRSVLSAKGTVPLQKIQFTGNSNPTYRPTVSDGTLSVESVSPHAVSGRYVGPFYLGNPSIKIEFERVPL